MAEEGISTTTDELATIPYDVIRDKTLNHHDNLYKLIIIGDSCKYQKLSFSNFAFFLAVGKSCLLARVMDEEFKVEHQVTIGVEFGSFVIKMDEKIIKM